MIKITCDVRDKVWTQQSKKVTNDSWILGYDLEMRIPTRCKDHCAS